MFNKRRFTTSLLGMGVGLTVLVLVFTILNLLGKVPVETAFKVISISNTSAILLSVLAGFLNRPSK